MSLVVSVHSFRGGTGKSNLSANLGATLARQGRRVALVDTDIQSPGIHVLFGLDENTMGVTLNDYLYGRATIEEVAQDVTARLGDNVAGELYLLPSSIKSREIARILREGYDVNLLQDGFRELVADMKLDVLIIDTHPGLNEETLISIGISDVLVLILRPDRQDFQGTAVTVDVARKLGVENLYLVVNKALPVMDFAAMKQQLEKTYDAPIAAILPLSEDMIQLASSGLFSLEQPEHPYSEGIRNLAGLIKE